MMRLITPALLGLLFIVVDNGIFVASQANMTNETAMDGGMMDLTEAPDEGNGTELLFPESSVAPSLLTEDSTTMVPSEEMTMDESTAATETEVEAPTAPQMNMTSDSQETMAPTFDETMDQTLIDVDDVAGNATDLDEVEQEAVGNVTVETDDPPPATAAPTIGQTVATMATTMSPTTSASTETPPLEETVIDTSAPTETPVTSTGAEGAPAATPAPGPPSTECVVQVENTDAQCAQLLKFTSQPCDCYNFCSGRLTSCLAFGQKKSFTCSGETVAGCTIDQKGISTAPSQRSVTLTTVLVASTITLFMV